MSTREEIAAFLAAAVPDVHLGDDDDIFAGGYVNSLFAMELITFLERAFDIAIESDDLELENFSTLGRLTALVEGKTAQPAT